MLRRPPARFRLIGPVSGLYRFGPFELDAAERRLLHAGTPLQLAPRLLDTLVLLAGRAGHLVTKRELLDTLWPDTTVEESNLAKNVWLLRQALSEAAGDQPWIETVPRAGYRFLPAVEVLPRPAAQPAQALPPEVPGILAAAPRKSREEPIDGAPASTHGAPPPRAGVTSAPPAATAAAAAGLAAGIAGISSASADAGRAPAATAGAAEHQPPAAAARRKGRWGGGRAAPLAALVAVVAVVAAVAIVVAVAWWNRGRAAGAGKPPAAGASATLSSRGAALYAASLAQLRVLDAVRARNGLDQVVGEAPRYAPAHVALARAWEALGYDERAHAEAAIAAEVTRGQRSDTALDAAAELAASERRWNDAIAGFGDLLRRSGGTSVEAGLRLAAVETQAARGRDALATLAALHRLPPPAGDDPRLDLAEAAAHIAQGEFRQAVAAAERAIAGGRARRAPLILAEARLLQAGVFDDLGEVDRQRVAGAEALQLFAAAGDTFDAARARLNQANLALASGELDGAEGLYMNALATFEAVGSDTRTAAILSDLALLHLQRGRPAAAEGEARRVLALRRALHDSHGEIWALTTLAFAQQDRGALDQAQADAANAEHLSRQLGDALYLAFALGVRGRIEHQRGRLAAARNLFEEALAIIQQLGASARLAERDIDLGGVLLDQDDLASAETLFRRGLISARQTGSPADVATALLHLAVLANLRGAAGEAAAFAQQARQEYDREGDLPDSALASAALASAEAALGDRAAARASEDLALRWNGPDRPLAAQIDVLLDAARAETALGDRDRAAALLQQAEQLATPAGLSPRALAARLLRAESALHATPGAAARAQIQNLAGLAAQSGQKLLQREAQDALNAAAGASPAPAPPPS